jgi:Arc/MetJ-type ribon-helix-helix transcriptional regulator
MDQRRRKLMDAEKKETRDKKYYQAKISEFGDQIENFAVKTAESIKTAIDKAMESRNTVLTIRVNDESNKKLNMLVETGLFRSRSESAAFLIEQGIRGQEALFKKITNKLETIEKIREELKTIISQEIGTDKTS